MAGIKSRIIDFKTFNRDSKVLEDPKKYPIKEAKEEGAEAEDENGISAEEFNKLLTKFVRHELGEIASGEETEEDDKIAATVEQIKSYMVKNGMWVEKKKKKEKEEGSEEEGSEEAPKKKHKEEKPEGSAEEAPKEEPKKEEKPEEGSDDIKIKI